MNIPNMPSTKKIVDKDGNLTTEWYLCLQQLFINLNNGLSNEGIIMPGQTTANIAVLATAQSNGALLYDNQLNVAKVILNATVKTITTS